ncbi:MAG TPA: hypothetical protein VNJ02_14315, partial [Vicinamibacterales bacterium]|nr:hypothetical protein [Vicinamibacterales bacterium]
GLTVTSFSRTYTNDAEESASPGIRERIEATILAPQSTVVELWGREMVAGVLADWFDHGRGPSQVVGALYTWEAYHRGVAAHLRAAAKQDS